MRCPPSPIRYGLFFALIAALIVLQPMALDTYLDLTGGEGGAIRAPALPEGVPVPRALAWSDSTIGFIERIGPITRAGVLGIQIGLWGILLYALLRALNPTFRLTSGVDWDHTLLTRTYMHTAPLIKAFLIAIAAFVPGFAVWWGLAVLFGENAWSLGLRLVLVGAAMWVLFSRESLAGDYESGNYELPRDRRVLGSLAFRGALAGAVAAVLCALAPVATPDFLLRFYHSLGSLTEANWWRLVGISVGLAAGMGFGGGGAIAALAPGGLPAVGRLRRAAAPLIVLAVTLWLGRFGIPSFLASRYDFPIAGEPGPALVRAAGVPEASPAALSVLAFAPDRVRALTAAPVTNTGMPASAEAARRVAAFVRRRHGITALGPTAYRMLFDTAARRWDLPAALEVGFEDLARCPDPGFLPPVLMALQTGAATPEALRGLDRLADGRSFIFDDRDSRALMGDLYAGLGQRAAAERWYRKADLPEWQVMARLSERVRFTGCRVTGRVLLDGRPTAGIRVGVAPPAALRELDQPGVGAEVGPFWFRWVSASKLTGPDGRFTLERLPAGRYFLLVAGDHPLSPADRAAPRAITLSAGTPTAYLGDVRLISRR